MDVDMRASAVARGGQGQTRMETPRDDDRQPEGGPGHVPGMRKALFRRNHEDGSNAEVARDAHTSPV
ncbi:hypothetical protein GCM10010266_61520 [Streptomyces griseomycini]|nr:hypothetical protein GCM10010266_61520 [Streptomyces griseomycini]GGR49416.1 hypothetical protein GCM10015536_63850 [Streptomyces griseomycini]